MNTVTLGWPLVSLVIALTGAAGATTRLAGLGRGGAVVVAATRAVVQLAAVSLVIGFVLRSLALTAGFLALMIIVAAGTSAHRITGSLRPSSWWTAVPILAGIVPTMGAILLNGAHVGTGSIVGAGAVVREGMKIPPNSLVLGVPGRIARSTTEEEHERIRKTVQAYLDLQEQYRQSG